MYLDKNLTVSDSQSIAQVAGTYLSDNSIDLWNGNSSAQTVPFLGGSPVNDVGRGNQLPFLIQVTEDVASGGAATVDFKIVMADDAALTTNLTVLESTGALAKTTLVAGYQVRLGIHPGALTKRYLGAQYVVATATTTAGKVTAGFVADRQTTSV